MEPDNIGVSKIVMFGGFLDLRKPLVENFPPLKVERVQSGFIPGSKVFEEWVLLKSNMLCAIACFVPGFSLN